jgi:hypothetical protein
MLGGEMSPEEAMKGTADARNAFVWRAAGALCVLTMVVFGVLAGQYYFASSDSNAVDLIAGPKQVALTAADEPSAAPSMEAGRVSSSCGSCDARHRHILRLREADP